MRTWRIGRAAAGAVGLVCAIIYLLEGRNLPFGRMNAPGPGVFPLFVGVIFAVVSAWVIADALLTRSPGRTSFPKGRDLRRLLTVFGAFCVYVVLFNVVGFLVSTVALAIVFTRAVGEISWLKAAAWSVLVTGLVWGAFVVLLGVRLPAGILGGLWG
jgi:hypothetical protein